MSLKVIQQGAEAVIYRKEEKVLKKRVKKGYRFKELDEKMRKLRTRGEARILERAGKVISVPRVERVDEKSGEIEMEFILGEKLSESLDETKDWKKVCGNIGENIGKLHEIGVIHGDLTTSNMIYNDKVYFIDFGLSYGNGRIEDMAVDLHLIKQALEAKHFEHWAKYWKEIEKTYEKFEKGKEVLKRLEKVEKRGRYKESY